MSAVAHHDYAQATKTGSSIGTPSWPFKRLIIAAVGCAIMALSGGGLANYLDTSGSSPDASGFGASQADAATLN